MAEFSFAGAQYMFKNVKGRRRAAASNLLEQEIRTAPQAEGPSEEPNNQEEPEFQDAEVGDEPPVESSSQFIIARE